MGRYRQEDERKWMTVKPPCIVGLEKWDKERKSLEIAYGECYLEFCLTTCKVCDEIKNKMKVFGEGA